MAGILIVDDEEIHARALARFLAGRGHACEVATSAVAAQETQKVFRPNLVLLDLRLGDADGLDVLRELKAADPALPVIMMTAYGSVETAVRAMKAGALDYVQKPMDLEELELVVTRALGEARTRERLEFLQRREVGRAEELALLGGSAAMRPVHDFIERAARFEGLAAGDHPTVLLLGETGTGKDLVARIIHARSTLAREAFIALDCTALPRNLIEAGLFGYERGAFTDAKTAKRGLFEVAAGGTIFLDEIGELDLDAQGKLLRAIEEKKVRRVGGLADCRVDARVIAATNRDLARLANEGRFRLDLLYRLKVLTLTLPPLRERGDDVGVLATHFLDVYARKYDRRPKRLTPDATAALAACHWVGNVRELAHVIERATLLVESDTVDAWHLGLESHVPAEAADTPDVGPGTLEATERQLLRSALESNGWNVSVAARRLGVTREVLRYRMRKHGLVPPGR
ncbi:MAG TPA: sigma-54 dependent transcriptional regulator [Candidatus Binatia bacterium]|nr:sigma-54 dependent transcriptional regulator [Candidatus Binatia bacterium]